MVRVTEKGVLRKIWASQERNPRWAKKTRKAEIHDVNSTTNIVRVKKNEMEGAYGV
jgi:hypothetical protein